MKLVKEILYEKFSEDSDPIQDLGIGLKNQLDKWISEVKKEGWFDTHDINVRLRMATYYGKLKYVKYLLDIGADINANHGYPLKNAINRDHIQVVKYLLKHGAETKFLGDDESTELKIMLRDEKNIKESLNEKFAEVSDPIRDLNIGVDKLVETFKNDLYQQESIIEDEALFHYFPEKRLIEIDCWPIPNNRVLKMQKTILKIMKKYKNIFEITEMPTINEIDDGYRTFIKIKIK